MRSRKGGDCPKGRDFGTGSLLRFRSQHRKIQRNALCAHRRFRLLDTAHKKAVEMGLHDRVGLCVSSDNFYDDKSNWKLWAEYGVLGIEMEAAELYTLAAKFGRKALAILTVSDHILLGGQTTAEERQTSFTNMIKLALETITA